MPAVLTETSAEITAWDAETEEQDMLPGAFSGARTKVLPPPSLVLTTGSTAAITSGAVVAAGVLAAWAPSPSPSAIGYEWEWMLFPLGGWQSGGYLDRSAIDSNGVFSALISFAAPMSLYRVRVRTVGMYGRSDWSVSDPIIALGPDLNPNRPPMPVATAINSSRIDISAQQANDSNARELLFYANDIDSPLTAAALDSRNAGASVTVTVSETGLTAGTTRYYFTRARDQWGNLSDFSASASATTP